MLRISKLADYANVIMAFLAHHPQQVFKAHEVAEKTRIALPTVSKLLKIMTNNGLVVSYRGLEGGYRLARLPEAIHIIDIMDAVEGKVGLTECSVAAGLCEQEVFCGIRGSWQTINRLVRQSLSQITLADMVHM